MAIKQHHQWIYAIELCLNPTEIKLQGVIFTNKVC